MKSTNFFAIAIMAVCLASCGGGNDSKNFTLNPETTRIKGDLDEYYEVVEREYTTTTDNVGNLTISADVKRTDVEFSFDVSGVEPCGSKEEGATGFAGFGLELLDEKGNVIVKRSASSMYSQDDMKEALKLKAGETGTIRWHFSFLGTDELRENKPAKFRLTSVYEKNEDHGTASHSSSSDDNSSSSGSQDWNALLNSYEQYVDKYISVMKKASKGDERAFAEYPALLEKAQECGDKMQNAQGEMTASQWARYMKITNKMSQAAAAEM